MSRFGTDEDEVFNEAPEEESQGGDESGLPDVKDAIDE